MAKRWEDWMNLLVGLWLLISPLLMAFPAGYGSTGAWNSYISGALLIVINWVALARPAAWQEWISVLIGAWLIVATFALGIADQRLVMWNNLIAGLVVLLGAIAAINWIRIRPDR